VKHAKEVAQAAVASIQSMQTAKNGPASSGAEEVPGKGSPPATSDSKQGSTSPQADEQAAKALAQEKVINTQAAQNSILMQELAEMREQLAAQQPSRSSQSALLPPVVLQAPAMPTDPAAQQACLALCQSLRLLAQQEHIVAVTWADLTRAHMPWTDFIHLVPILEVAKTVKKVGTARAPEQHLEVPRRLLELLRTQLECIVAEMTSEQKAVKQKAQLESECRAWAETVIDQALRISERKRPPALAAEDIKKAQEAPLPAEQSGATDVL
jgi:hypothetical protein